MSKGLEILTRFIAHTRPRALRWFGLSLMLFLILFGGAIAKKRTRSETSTHERYPTNLTVLQDVFYSLDDQERRNGLDSMHQVAQQDQDTSLYIQYYLLKAIQERDLLEYDEALLAVTDALQLAHAIRDTLSLREVYYMLGMVYQDQENYMASLAAYRESLRMETPSYPIPSRRKFAILNNSALIYVAQNDYDDATNYYNRALQIQDTSLRSFRARMYCNLASLGERTNNRALELSSYYNAFLLGLQTQDTLVLSNVHLGLAHRYARDGLIDFARYELEIFHRKYDDYEATSFDMADSRLTLLEIYTLLGDYHFAERYIDETFRCLKGDRNQEIYRNFLIQRAKLAAHLGKYNEAYTLLDSVRDMRANIDVLLHVLRFDAKELDVITQTDQDEEIIKKLRRENELHKQEQNRRLFFLTLAFIIFAFVLTQRYLRTHLHILQKTHTALVKESEYARQLNQKWLSLENVLNNQRADLEQSSAFLHYILNMLHENTDKVNRNIQFVQNIQQVLLPKMELIQKAFGEAFLLYLPRDTVSGDFYWYAHAQEYELLALVDCAGHGVPGALMSLIGHVLLNKIVKEWHIYDPAQILTTLHEQIHENLGYHSTTYLGHYSMDLSIIRYERAKQELVFSSASSSVYFVTAAKVERYRGSIMSAGSTLTDCPYTNQTRVFTESTWVYLTSDGYTDQLNDSYRKFGNQRFQDLLWQMNDGTADENLYFLTDNHYTHKGGVDQADDICVIGIHFVL
ncbi:MAG: SpoIIE family protein phosphatase [Bacteroides sp.]